MWEQGIVFFVLLSRVYSQLPERCERTQELKSRQCCVFRPFFDEDTLRHCGADFSMNITLDENKITLIKKIVWSECEHWICVLQKYNILENDSHFKVETYYSHLDKWLTTNQQFIYVINEGKIHCGVYYDQQMYHACDYFPHLNKCIRNFVNYNCPVIISSKLCEEQKRFYKECGKYYL